MMKNPMICPCHSHKKYVDCCEPFHRGLKLPKKPVELMRSRYAAYALQLADYIISTTHPKSAHYSTNISVWREEILIFSEEMKFLDLKILSEEEGFPISYVTFRAFLKCGDEDASFTERSCFIFENNRWFFS